MARIPFKVSARAARLIGRENVATSQGAITELVKNAYDADGQICAVLFVPRYAEPPEKLSLREYAELQRVFPDVETYYSNEGDRYTLSDKSSAASDYVKSRFANLLDLWIIDNGHGMSMKTIENNWMVIGTDTKEVQSKSVGGRIVTGAKGIGRFALDRLGQECEMYSALPGSSDLAHWVVDWGDFEGSGKVISDVEAILETESLSLISVFEAAGFQDILPKSAPARGGQSGAPISFGNGTAIRIASLHDIWDHRDSLRLKDTLEALLPPKDRGDFDIFIYDHRVAHESGFIDNFPPDQFDYRLVASVDHVGEVSIELTRQELDVERINPLFFGLESTKNAPFRKEDFDAGSVRYKTNLRKLLNLTDEEPVDDYLAIGPFDFTLYFFKLVNPAGEREKYPQKNFDVTARRRWLSNSGGVRLYRDNFRVRPYGEPNTQGSDWLLLGQRVAANPAAVSRIGWRVAPQALAGTVNITKEHNPLLGDQSNREGIMNERAFSAFRRIIIALIGEFEFDRAYIFHNLQVAFDLANPEEKEVEEGKELADKILEGQETKSEPAKDEPVDLFEEAGENSDSDEKGADADDPAVDGSRKIAKALKSEERKNEDLKEDMRVMRGMATLGTVLISFTHELKQIRANMDSRQSRLRSTLATVIDEKLVDQLPDPVKPLNILDRWSREDEKISRWIKLALSAVSPTKRRRSTIDVADYLSELKSYWQPFLDEKHIELTIDVDDLCGSNVLAHEVDLDSIFYNLIANSFEAITRPSNVSHREIWISGSAGQEALAIEYRDSGPGLSETLNLAEDIFLFGVTTKGVQEGATIEGTGLGMWVLKNIVDDYQGEVSILSELGEAGFKLLIELPKYVVKDADDGN